MDSSNIDIEVRYVGTTGTATDVHVVRRDNHSREIRIYDRLGGMGSISLTLDEARFVRDRLDEVLSDG